MELLARLHTLPGLVLVAGLAVLALMSGVMAVLDRPPMPSLDFARRVLLGIIVAEAAIGLVLTLRGAEPDEWIHWLYGGIIIAALLVPATLVTTGTPRSRSAALAGAAGLAAIFAWRLWGTG
jgi:heme A synthase